MKEVFLESHNVKNLYFGFGQFNYHLIKGLYAAKAKDLKIILHAKDTGALKTEFGDYFKYKKYFSFRRYNQFAIRKKYDLWHSLNQNIVIEPYYDIPYILTVHDVNFVHEVSSDMNHIRNIRFKEKLARSNAIVYISNFAKEATHNYFDVPNVPEYVIYNGNTIGKVDIPENYKPNNVVLKNPFLFTIGEINERKNFHTLVEMLQFLPKINLIISGKNSTEYAETIQKLIAKYKLENRVYVTGKISEKDKYYYLQNCLAFVFPSLREGFGIPPIEAMSFGKPVFLAHKTSLPEIGGDYAFYWEHFDPKYMADVFTKGMDIFENNREDYELNYKKRATNFSWNTAASEYLEVYRQVLNNTTTVK